MAKANTKAPKSKASKKSTKVKETPVVETPVVEPVVETPVVDTPAETPTEKVSTVEDELLALGEDIKQLVNTLKSLSTRYNTLQKRVVRDQRVMEKKVKGRVKKEKDPNKPPSGFAKPGPVSKDLRSFLGLKEGDLISRTKVTQAFTAYCKEHNLQKDSDKRTINADKTVTKLLRLDKNSPPLTFFNLQRYMKIHYPNKEGVIPADA